MAAILLSAFVTCVCSLFIGQAVLRICGAAEWSWMAPPVGLSALMLIATPAIDIPGRATTMAILVALLSIAAIFWCLRAPAHRPPVGGLLAAIPVAFLVLIPFLAVGRGGILGVTVDNDMAAHLVFAETYLSEAVELLKPGYYDLYPFGPHAIAGVLARGLDMRVDHSFTGLTMAIPLLNAWTALAFIKRGAWWKKALAATVISMPFLVTAYYGQGSFKELIETGLVLGTVAFFAGEGPRLGRGRWVPLALLAGGMISVYSETGLAWPVAIGVLWLVISAGLRVHRRGTAGMVDEVRAELPPIGIGIAVLILTLLPQISRIHNFISANSGAAGIIVPKDNLGNLVAPLPGWEGFGVWNTADYRLPDTSGLGPSVLIGVVVAVVLFGAWRLCRNGRWMLPVSAAGALVIWRVSMHSQSPYVVAKALVIASPLLLATAILPLLELVPNKLPWSARSRGSSSRPTAIEGGGEKTRRPLVWCAAAALAIVVFVIVGISDARTLRFSPVGPTYQADELRGVSPLLHYKPTLFLGNDDFIKWELPGVPVKAAQFSGAEEVPIRAEKQWENGEPLDFDSVDAKTLNEFDYVITTNDRAGSEPPPQMRLIESTPNFQVWRRTGEVRERSILPEGEGSGAVLDCSSPEGHNVLRAGGVAAIRPAPVIVTGPPLDPAQVSTVELPLVKGDWTLESSYLSRLPIKVTGPGIEATLKPNLDRSGPRFPIGKISVHGTESVALTFTVASPLFARAMPIGEIAKITATREAPERVVPIHQACGKYVDWFRGAGSAR
jgi:hypothetical protein